MLVSKEYPTYHKKCVICGKEFDTKKGHQKTCCLDCRLVYIKMSKARIYQSKKDVDKVVEIKDVAKTFEVGNCKMCGRRARLRDGFCSKLCKTKWTVENEGLGEMLTDDAIWHIQKWHFVDGDSIEKLAEVYQVPKEVIAAALRQETPERWSSWKNFYVENRVWRNQDVRLG